MPKKIIRPGQLGPYYPAQRADTGQWYVTRYDRRKRRTHRESGPYDGYRDCETAVARTFLGRPLADSAEPSLDIIFARYLDYMKGRPSAPQAAFSIERLYEFFQLEGTKPSRAELTVPFQERFIAWRGATCGGNTISRDMSVYSAALNRVYHRRQLSAPQVIIDVDPATKAGDRERVLARDEIAALMDAAADHVFVFIFISLNTGARPAAALELGPPSCDYERRLVDLSGGRPRAYRNKRRPILPMTDAFKRQLEDRQGERFVLGARGPLKSIRKAFDSARDLAGVSADVHPVTLRHTVATELRARGVAEWEAKGFMGHRPGSSIENYAKYRPDYLSDARQAIDAWIDSIPSDRILRSGLRSECDPKPYLTPAETPLSH